MPASRIAFAIGDLISEIKALMPVDADLHAELRLDPPTYERVKREIENHYGQQMVFDPKYRMPGECFKLGGLIISKVMDAGN